jgi:O-antigen/teichoic acid export membrane protein
MNFRRWVVFSFLVHLLVILVDKGAGLVLFALLADRAPIKGVADVLTILPFVMTAVANLGLATSLVYYVRRHGYDVQTVAETTSMVAVVWGTVVAILGAVFALVFLPIIKPTWTVRWTYVLPICASVPFMLVMSYFNSIQLAIERIRDYNLVHLLASALFLPMFLVFYVVGGGAEAAPGGIALARFAVAVLMAIVTVRLLRGIVRFRPRLHGDFLRLALAYGWKANINSVLAYINVRLNLFVLPLLFLAVNEDVTKAEIAFYSLAATLAELVWHFPEALRDLFFTKVTGETDARARELTPVLARLCLALAIVGGLAVLLLVNPVMWLLSSAVGKSGAWEQVWSPVVVPVLAWLLLGTVPFTVARVLQNDLAARRYLNSCIAAGLVVLLTMLLLDWLWIPAHGALGAARAAAVAFAAACFYTLWAYRRSGGAPVLDCLIPRRSDLVYVRDIASGVIDKLRRKKPA